MTLLVMPFKSVFFANYPYFDDVGLIEAIKIGYGNLTIKDWAIGRWENVRTTVGYFPLAYTNFFEQLPSESLHIRTHTFTYIGISLGPTILGYFLALFSWKEIRPSLKSAIRYLLLTVMVGLFIWIILILPRARTIIHHGSYYFPVLIMFLGGLLIQNRPRLLIALFAVQLVYFQMIWGTPAFQSEWDKGRLLNINFVDPGAISFYTFSVFLILLLIFKSPQNDQTLHEKNPS